MLAPKKGEFTSLGKYSNVICALSVVISVCLLNGCIQNSVAAEAEISSSPEHIEKSCTEKCPDQNQNASNSAECMDKCGQNQCAAGCRLWELALDTSCKVACNTTDPDVEDWYCVMGCNNAISQYFKWLMAEIGTPPAPALLADSLTSTSLSLEWEIPENLAEIMKRRRNVLRNYLVQWRYEESGNDWKYYRNQSMEDSSTIQVENLQPYTKYRFRVALILSSFREIELYSEQSLVIITAEEGPPQSEPDIVRAVAVDHTRISIAWEPGLLKNGPILFYVLQIKESHRDTYFAIKDIPNEQQEILIGNLQPSTNYTVEIMMRNKGGVGPPASVNVTTTEKPEVRHDDETLKLIIASDFQILMQGLRFFYEIPNFIYNSSEPITGIGIHVAKKLLFITDTYNIYRAPLSNSTLESRVRIYSTENTNQVPLVLSVDWLNDKLYILFESDTMNQKGWQISRCNIDGSHLQVVYGGLPSKPVHFQVDPFNGYLFWSFSSSSKSDGGLYRLDLSDVSNGVKHEIEPTRIFNHHDIGVFTIDYTKYNILAPIDELNTVMSMDLNGDNYKDIRNNTQTPMFRSVKSFALANDDLFYWSNGSVILTEDYHELSDHYYTSIYKEFAQLKHFIYVGMKLPSAQPTPKPLNPPSNVQALLSVDRAKVSWRIPHLLSIQGRGAWQDWTYKLEVIDEENSDTNQTLKGIKTTHYTVSDLKPDTKYRFRVTAYTNAGSGPYSVEYMGQTLKKADNREIVWSSHDGLIQSDILAENVHTLIPQPTLNACNISNLEWFEDILYYVCGNLLYSFNRTTNDTKKLDVKDSVQAIAVDWIGRRLYWFNPLHQVLTRGNLINFESEILFALTAVEVDIKIDAIRGYLYFSTGNSVEYCRLNCNDKNRKKFYTIESFTGRKVMGLTLDFDINRVYWIIRGYESATLAIAPLIYDEYSTVVIEEFILTENKILGPLAYLSNRLMWLQDDHTIVVGNLTGKNLAHIKNIELSDLRAFLVIDKTQRNIPDLDEPLNVIPEAVNASTIHVTGKWNFFTIIWQPIESVNYGEVSYEIRYLNQTVVEKRPFLEIKDDKIPAHSQLNVTIKAFTYWASSVAVKKIVYSPSAPPSEPLEPRLFVNHVHNPLKDDLDIDVIFRWNTPKSVNGPLIGYKIQCWYVKDNIHHEKYNDYEMQPEKNEKYIEKVEKNATFYCKVRAETRAGVGNYSSLISINTQNEKPIPQLFATSNDKIYIVDFDLKLHKSNVNAGSKVEHLCYIALNKEFFWANENNELMAFSRDGRKKLYSMNTPVLSLTVDWIERIVYWSQSESKGSSINSFNLNTQKSKRILKSPHFIINLNVAPLNRQLFWIDSESDISNRGKLVSLHLDDEQSSAFLGSKNESILVTQQTLFLDTFTVDHEKVVWLSEINQLMSTDIRTRASTVVNFTYQPNMMNFNRDSARIYWTQNNITFAENQLEQAPYQHTFFYPMKILPIFRQNYPPLRCLLPPKYFYQIARLVVHKSTDRALWLNLPVPKGVDNCSFVPMFWKFRIMYAELENEEPQRCSLDICNSTETSDKLIEINNLKPYTKYQFQISISNYYTENLNMSVFFTRPLVFQTETGAPSSPRNVTTQNVSPTEIHLSWLPPLEMNGPEIQYEVHYSTENEINGKKNQFKMTVKGENVTSININELLPNQPYIVWVQAHTTEILYSESPHLKIKTLPDPEMIKLISSTSKSLTVEWEPYANASRYVMLCRPIEYNDSFAELILDSAHEINNTNSQRTGNKVTVLKLHPKSRYVYWLQFWFKNRVDAYTWPQKERFVFETHTDRPSAPGKPSTMIRNNEYEVTWTPADSNGAKIEEYILEGLRVRALNRAVRSTNSIENHNQANTLIELRQTINESKPIADSWIVYYKGNDTFWKVEGLTDIAMYSFRVKARNANGWGEYSALSERITDIPPLSTNSEQLVIAVAAPALIAILIVTFSCFVCASRRKQSKQSDKKNFSDVNVELATLPHLPRSTTFVQSNNILYTFGPITDGDVALLPQIRSDQITRTNFLGSGAFGEVYEGFLGHIDTEPKTRVAIKTLRKGATQQEKDEFLQEAQLMSNFKHKHILSLIGVCFDNDTFYIIMELMQGGDLLSFLRQNRPCDVMASALTLLDLTTMCVDIASGCRYLEEMHFVHRDLACRNCLVSSIDPENRVVKIGDFGLARDIYKNDYYRKDGEGLLPVRWMSPESLVDGVFTSQSDIWAFGVLCWEIMTLGQQPYPARNNVEVLHYVRDGGRLDRPMNCPDDLYQLMLKCWSYRPEERPTFRYCLDILQSLRTKFDDIRINLENANRNFADVVKYVNTPIASEMYSVPKGINSMPKYLEIIYDANDDQPQPPNPYEIPLPALDENEIVHTSSPTPSEKSSNKSTEFDSIKSDANKEIKVKSRTVSSSSTVSETSVYNTSKKREALNVQPEDDDLSETNAILNVALPKQTSNEQLLPPPPPPPIQQQTHDNSKRKLKQMYANANIESAIRNCDGITSM
ncbi:proto-oncogene tyrosine-protein kinase ROS-like isoform X2 [Contarinia nasturtii]|uniref:proto-oncogene tyrosine-protein kinase ROS-like isoform X2 n=1 Tax=Contarinia nasturtii TaxID=265458 RepID=UPI0012D3BA02|nr:proto-oncogene tyrosine-protein kinase ROS-like isoform X2 [Contarinia nasturtii]